MFKCLQINKPSGNFDFLAAIRERNNEVIQKIYDLHYHKVSHYVHQNHGSEVDAKNVFDKAIYQISARLDRDDFQIHTSFEAFLFTACKNLWRRELNKQARRRGKFETVKELYYEQKQFVQSTMEQERWELFREKLNEISTNCKRVLELSFDQASGKDIMEELDYKSESTARQRIFKCRQKLISLVKKDQRYVELKSI